MKYATIQKDIYSKINNSFITCSYFLSIHCNAATDLTWFEHWPLRVSSYCHNHYYGFVHINSLLIFVITFCASFLIMSNSFIVWWLNAPSLYLIIIIYCETGYKEILLDLKYKKVENTLMRSSVYRKYCSRSKLEHKFLL